MNPAKHIRLSDITEPAPIYSPEQKFISCILNDPQPLPDIFKFLSAQDFEDIGCAWIYAAFDATYSGMAMDTPVWFIKMRDWIVENGDVNATETRLELRALADMHDPETHPVTLALLIRKESLHRKMVQAAEEWARFNVYRGGK